MTLRSMAATQATTTTTLNPSPDRKQAAGRNTKWKLGEPTPTPLRKQAMIIPWRLESSRATRDNSLVNVCDSRMKRESGLLPSVGPEPENENPCFRWRISFLGSLSLQIGESKRGRCKVQRRRSQASSYCFSHFDTTE